MNKRQKEDLAFYLNEFSLERDTMRNGYVQYTDHKTFNLSLCDPQFSYMTKNKQFKMQIKPILGAEVIGGKKGAVVKRWYGAELQMDIAHHVSIWGSLRDNSWNGEWFLRDKYYPNQYAKIDGAKLTKAQYLNNLNGVQYKEANYGGDFSDSKGGINLYTWWGSIGVSRENIRWGDAYHASNILSGRNPAVPQVTLQLTPVWWFQFDYFHAWLVSNVKDSTDYYIENTTKGTEREYRPRSKYMAANMFTFKPCKWVHFSVGNSIVYAENNKYTKSTINRTVTVSKLNTNLSLESDVVTINVFENVGFVINVSDDGNNPICEGVVVIYENGVNVANLTITNGTDI